MGQVIGIVGSMRFRGYMDELERHLIREGHTLPPNARGTGEWFDRAAKQIALGDD